MPADDTLARFAERLADERPTLERRLEVEAWEDLGSFGWLRGQHERSVMLELRRKDGRVVAVGYGWLEKAEFDPSDGIALHIVGQTIRIRGRNLNAELRPQVRLFEGIARHRVPWIREASHGERLRTPESACLIESIDW